MNKSDLDVPNLAMTVYLDIRENFVLVSVPVSTCDLLNGAAHIIGLPKVLDTFSHHLHQSQRCSLIPQTLPVEVVKLLRISFTILLKHSTHMYFHRMKISSLVCNVMLKFDITTYSPIPVDVIDE